MRQSHPRYLTVTALILVMLAAFLVGYRVRDYGGMRPAWAALAAPSATLGTLDNTVTLRPVELFKEALEQVQLNYVEPIKQPEELVYSAIRGMLLPLNDPYTRFMDPKEYAEFNTDNQGSLSGIGATLSMLEIPAQTVKADEGMIPNIKCPVCETEIKDVKHYRVGIVEPLPGSPAKEAGVKAGDFILKVDGENTDGKTVSEVAQQIRGLKGTKVTLTVARKGIEKPLDIAITRAQIEVPSLEKKMLDDKIGYLHLLTFNEKTTLETREALQWLRKEGARGLVLDLRNNPGGLLRQCIFIASMLLPDDNKLIVETKTRSGRNEPYHRSGQQLWDQPIVVLVNKGSASASEILSGALKDYKRATIVGEPTFGKALVQTVIPLSDRSAMAITTAHYYTPNGYDVGKKGVMPDITVELAKDTESLSEKDNQALEAIRILKTEMAKAK
jgi:carboxyl-terminal processing protease